MKRPLKKQTSRMKSLLLKISVITALFIWLVLPICISGAPSQAASAHPAMIGKGSYEELGQEYFGYYRIADADDLYWFASEAKRDPDICGLIVNDIEDNAFLTWNISIDPLTGKPSVHNSIFVNEWDMIPSFSGTLDGGGHTVSGIYVNTTYNRAGMFRVIEEGGEVKNLTINDSYIYTSANTAGTLAGVNYGKISDVKVVVGGASSGYLAGGIVGENQGEIRKAEFAAAAQGKSFAGGIAGLNSGVISYSFSGKDASVGSDDCAGGIAGESTGEINYCYSTALVLGIANGPIVSDIPSGGTYKACYYVGENVIDGKGGTEGKSLEAFISGEVCYLLNKEEEVYFQTVGKGEPGFVGKTVYYAPVRECPGSDPHGMGYSNNDGDIINHPDHFYYFVCSRNCYYCDFERNDTIMHTYVDNCSENCYICGDYRTPPHSYDNDCDEVCNDCEAIRAVIHSYDDDCDAECNICHAHRDDAPHKFSSCEDMDCNLCDFERLALGHKYDDPCDRDCNACGDVRNVSHDYPWPCSAACAKCGKVREAEEHTYLNLCDGDCELCGHKREVGDHIYASDCDEECDECGARRDADEHTYKNECDADCDICGGLRVPSDHVYLYQCSIVCECCGAAREDVAHSFLSCVDTTCSVCGFVRIPEGHVYIEVCSPVCDSCGEIREVMHRYGEPCGEYCLDCGILRPGDPHSYDGVCDGECNECGFLRDDYHEFSGACDTICNAEGCGFERDTSGAPHTYGDDCDIDCNVCEYVDKSRGHTFSHPCDEYCDKCGKSRGPREAHTYDNECDADCNVCGDVIEGRGHVYESPCDRECDICGEERLVVGHEYDNACDDECNLCGYVRAVEDHVYDNVCDADCNECGEMRDVAGHKYDSSCDPICNICGDRRSDLSHLYDNDCDDRCNVCGSVRDVPEHQFGDYYIVLEPTDNAEGIQSRRCEICGEIESEYIEPLGTSGDTVTVIVAVTVFLVLMAALVFALVKIFEK